ncbi:MAG: amino acid adenylation domain-containing protein [Legionella sp.]|nr:amino acid adenylation domain-containing protein [Legionella sp.]
MIHVASTYIVDVLNDSLKAILHQFCDQEISFHYNQIFQQALLPGSEFNENKNGLNVILMRMADLFNSNQEIESNLNDLITALTSLQKSTHVPLLFIVTPSEASTKKEKNYYLKVENTLKSVMEANKNTLFVSSEEILKSNQERIFDQFTEKHGHIPYTREFYESLAWLIGRKYSLLTRKPYKVIVLDCDGTLWNGIIEEDGLEGIIIDEEYLAFQQFMINLFHAGFLLCLCSKNSEKSVLDVLKLHKKMALDINKHICSYRINWLPKSVNIQSLANELNLGLDSFIFIDDNAIECAEVKAALPDVLVIELPRINSREESIPRLDYLKNIWAFDIHNVSEEDKKRTAFYKQNRLRETLKSESLSYEQFLKNLKIKIGIREANSQDLERVIQLSQRTNQFNLFPNAVSANEFNERILQRQLSGCLVIEVSDKYGDYGLVGVVVYDVLARELVIKSFFLSCRILGRGIEYAVVQHIVSVAEQHSLKRVNLLFSITERNIPGIAFIQHLSNQVLLEKLKHVSFSVEQLKKITPKLVQQVEKRPKLANSNARVSNDYMLDIAKESYHKKRKTHPSRKLATVEMSLIELFKQHKLWVEEKNVALIELGITSLDCVLLASTIYQRFHVEITPFELLKPGFTLEKLTRYLLSQLKSNHLVPELSILEPVMSLSSTQLRLWEDEQIFPDTARNNMFTAYEIEEPVNKEIMRNAFIQLMARHDALRFSFFAEKDGPLLKLNPLQSIDFKLDYFSCDNDADIEQYVALFRQKPFVLSQAPLFRAALIRKKKNKTLFLFSIHHIIHDGWSLNILLRELSDTYSACSKRITLPNPIESCPYLDFIRWQQKAISEEVLEKQGAFWKKYLSYIPKLELIYDKARKEEQEKPLNHRITFTINAKTTRKIKKMSLANQVTLYDVLLSAFGLFLSHLANQEDINFITAVSGRHHSCVGDVIGFFTNMVLIRMHLDDEETFNDLIKKNQKLIHNIFKNQDFPFNEIMQLTGEQVNSKIHAFNQVGFIFQSYPINHLTINNKIGKRIYADDKAELVYDACNECRFGNLVFFMQEHEGKIQGMVEYNTLLFDKKRILCMIDTFKTLITHSVEAQNKPARSISLLSASQCYRITHQWNQAPLNYSKNESILSYFYEQVSIRKNAVAVIHNEYQITYGELDKITNQLARKLKKNGVHQEVPIAIFLEKNITRIVAMLGIIKAGGAYVPLEIDIPYERINHIVRDSGILSVITSDKTDPYIKAHFPEIKTVLVTDSSIQSESNLPLPDATCPNQLAYILYTSGSTGKPKGVAIEQRGILRLVKSPDYIDINARDRIAQASTFIFDAATFEIWGALLNGACLVLIDKKVLLDAALLNAVINDKKISIMFLTTQLFQAYIQLFPQLFQNLNYLLVGGEAMLPEAVERLFEPKKKPHNFMNVYGPTENTTFSTSYLIRKNIDLHKPIPIGKPIRGTQVYVLDDRLNPTPVGAPGTLYVGGTGLARGYINQEAFNGEKYINYLHERIYNTGDIVTWQPDGNLRFLGRKDNQIKMNGYRIELDEIALELETHHLVVQAIVLVKTTHHHRQLVSYILLEPGNDLQDINLHHYLKKILPHYMLPKFYYQIEAVPVTDNGKVDKKLLLKSEFPAISYTEYEPATNILQENLISIYAEILHIPPTEISINAEFFDLGGTSITALHFIDKVNDKFNVTINFSTLYEHANVKALSEKISALLSKEKTTSALNFTHMHDSALKVINEGNLTKTPLVLVHPIGGTGFCYLDLIKLLPHNQPCYIIQDPSIDANQVLFEDIPAMAECYNKLLLNHFEQRKIILGGYSFGGMLSLEMVSQLEHQKLDKTIDRVITFDTWIVSDFLNVKAKEALKLSILRQYERVETNLINQHIDPKPWMELYYRRLQDLGFAYKPPKINKKIMLFKANQQLGEFSAMNDKTNYLKNHTSRGVDVHIVSGNHDTILQYPHVRGIGQLLNTYLKGKMH